MGVTDWEHTERLESTAESFKLLSWSFNAKADSRGTARLAGVRFPSVDHQIIH